MQNQIQKLEAEQAQKQAALEAALAAAKKEDENEAAKESNKVSSKDSTKDNLKDKESTKSNHKKNSHDKVAEKNSNIYEVAQGHFASKEWKKAILNYQKYVDEFPKGKEVSDSKYKIGVCFQELGMKDEAMAFYEEVVAHFSKSEAGKKAKLRLSKLKSKN